MGSTPFLFQSMATFDLPSYISHLSLPFHPSLLLIVITFSTQSIVLRQRLASLRRPSFLGAPSAAEW